MRRTHLALAIIAASAIVTPAIVHAQQPDPGEPIFENDAAWVFLVPDLSTDETVQERVSRKILQTLAEKAFTEAISEIAPVAVSKLGGFVVTFINEIPSVGNPTHVQARMFVNSALAEEANVQQDVLPLILFNYSDTFNAGVQIEIQKRDRGGRWNSRSTRDLVSNTEMIELNRLGSPDALYLVVPKRPLRFEDAGDHRLSITARSKDARTAIRIRIKDPSDRQSESVSGTITRIENRARSIHVVGQTGSGETLWVGCTVNPGDPRREVDLDAIPVRAQFDIDLSLSTAGGMPGDGFVVALWRRKVDRSTCTLGTGQRACANCLRMGYHLEGRVYRQEGTWNPDR